MSTYIMSDIHGCFYEFLEMLLKINFSKCDKLYILGDVIDRGAEPIKILQHIFNAENIVMLMGNHEKFMLDAANKNENISVPALIDWNYNGGTVTIRKFKELNIEEQEMIIDKISKLKWYEIVEVNNKKFLLTHAGVIVKSKKGIEEDIKRECKDEKILWNRSELLRNSNKSEYIIIHGHTYTGRWRNDGKSEIYHYDNGKKINIDCGCARKDTLGCLRLEDMKEFYVKCDENYY